MEIIKNIYFTTRFYLIIVGVVIAFVLGFFFPAMIFLTKLALFSLVILTLVDALLLFRMKAGVHALRDAGDRFSNGDVNRVFLYIENRYAFPVKIAIIDELPEQFQLRQQRFQLTVEGGETKTFTYNLRPVERGEYHFGLLNLFVNSPLGIVTRRFRSPQEKMVAVYPSYMQLRKYELRAMTHSLTEAGIKKVRRIGHTMEFDQIREYVAGDDHRSINWKATARRSAVMVNQYEDEKAQQVYSVIDMGRVMKLPFEGMTLLDYAINASLVISNVALLKHDKAGLITFSQKIDALVPADRKHSQMQKILEVLYHQSTNFLESDFGRLYATLKQKIRQRSLILLYTNFETLASMKRHLTILRQIARSHLLVNIFFANTELGELLDEPATNTEDIYLKTIAQKFAFEKRRIIKELSRYGIHSIYTTPQNLTVSTINKYLELKAMGRI